MFKINWPFKKLRSRSGHTFQIKVSAHGFIILRNDGQSQLVNWCDVDRITAYKLDLLTYDTICVAFEMGDEDQSVQICEEVDGFENLISHMNNAFPEINPNWHDEVMLPPFVTNFTVLFERQTII